MPKQMTEGSMASLPCIAHDGQQRSDVLLKVAAEWKIVGHLK